MKKVEIKQNNTTINKVTLAGTISLLALLLLFLVVTLFSTNSLASQITLLTEHPFTVNGDISDVKTDLALMRIRTERLQSYNQPDDIVLVSEALEDIYIDMEKLLNEIAELYLGPDEDIRALSDTYEELKNAHHQFLAFSKLTSSSTNEIAEYEKTYLYPLYDTFDADATRILTYVRSTQQSIFTSANQINKMTVIWSCIIIAATAVGLFYFQSLIRKMSQRLYQKNNQFEVLAETIDESFLIFSKEREDCDFVSSNTEKVIGIQADQLLADRSLIYNYMSKETAEELRNTMSMKNDGSWDSAIEFYNPQKIEPRWLQLRCYQVGEDENAKYIMTLTDHTEEKRANQALMDALISAQKANNAKKDFLSRMSHEIRTPMNAIIGMTTIAAASIEDSGRVEDCLAKISYASKHLLMLINDVLDMSRIESNHMKINTEPFELYQFLNNFVSVIYPQAANKGLEFTEKTSGFTDHTTYLGDPLRLNQILFNLTSNAIKFTQSGGKVSLEVSQLPPRGKKVWLRFIVSDTGIGMDEQGLKNLYTPFEQANASIAGKYGGTGLGMSITQNLVSLMGGHIKVKSKPNEGTAFTVELPFEQSNVDLQPLQEYVLESLKVLVVDDERDICEHTVLLLKKMKINAEWVLSGKEAVESVVLAQNNGNSFDICFIDWKMPEMEHLAEVPPKQILSKIL